MNTEAEAVPLGNFLWDKQKHQITQDVWEKTYLVLIGTITFFS